MTSKPGTISPPGYRRMEKLPSVASLMKLQNICAVLNSGGSEGPYVEVIFQLIFGLLCANTGAPMAAVPATAPSPAFLINERRCIDLSPIPAPLDICLLGNRRFPQCGDTTPHRVPCEED